MSVIKLGEQKNSMSAEHMQDPRVTLIGGGNGTAALFPEFTEHSSYVTAIISMSDDGGSTGRLSAELGVLPVGDLRNVMMAASGNDAVRQMRLSRLEGKTADGVRSALHGQSMGNIMLAGCLQEWGPEKGIDLAHSLWHVPGRVEPVTFERHTLVMQDGEVQLRGEHIIDEYSVRSATPNVWLEPPVTATDRTIRAIEKAEAIVFPGGSIYTSLFAATAAGGLRDALHRSGAPKIMIPNLLAEPHHTPGWHVADFARAFERHDIPVDVILYNDTPPSEAMLMAFANEGEVPVATEAARFAELDPRIRLIGASLVSNEGVTYSAQDALRRGRIRHDSCVVREHVWRIVQQHRDNLSHSSESHC